jgi:hypothetical protein
LAHVDSFNTIRFSPNHLAAFQLRMLGAVVFRHRFTGLFDHLGMWRLQPWPIQFLQQEIVQRPIRPLVEDCIGGGFIGFTTGNKGMFSALTALNMLVAWILAEVRSSS